MNTRTENEALRVLLERRSIRVYKPEQIPRETLDAILEAGLYAPSGMNLQSVTMVAVQDPATRDRLSAMNAAVRGRPGSDPFYGAPTVIVVLADRARSERMALEDGALAMGNLMNAAYALGIGSCWIHRAREVFDSDEGKALLAEWGLKGDFFGVGHCILGYAAEDPQAKERREGRIVHV